MSTIAAWQCLKVKEFIDQCNWQNIALPTTSASSVTRPRIDLTSWGCLTTVDFFALSNWSGTAVFADDVAGSTSEETTFGLTLASEQFWQCFNWSGEKKIPTPEKMEQVLEQTKEAIAEVEEFTLNDLSQLF